MLTLKFVLNLIPWTLMGIGIYIGWGEPVGSSISIEGSIVFLTGVTLAMLTELIELKDEVRRDAIERAVTIVSKIVQEVERETAEPSGEVPDADQAEGAEQQGQEGKG